jgi:hypothetical protein
MAIQILDLSDEGLRASLWPLPTRLSSRKDYA